VNGVKKCDLHILEPQVAASPRLARRDARELADVPLVPHPAVAVRGDEDGGKYENEQISESA
jgi:hypothetical protein